MEQQQQQPNNTQDEKVSKYWRWVAIGGVVVVLFLIYGSKKAEISLSWFVLIGVGYGAWLFYQYWLNRIRVPRFDEMIRLCVEHEAKRGCFLDDSVENTVGDPIGKDTFLIKFVKEEYTYVVHRNVVMSRTQRDIPEYREDIERSNIQNILAQKGLTEMIEK